MTPCNESSGPATCAEVAWEMQGAGFRESAAAADLGDLLWNPKAPAGHVLVAEVKCGHKHSGRTVDCGCGGWGMQPCPSTTLVCECGEDGSYRDHHYYLLARTAALPGEDQRG